MAARSANARTTRGPRSGTAASRRRALTKVGMEREVAEALVDMVDEAVVPYVTREESDARFEALIEERHIEREQDRGEIRGEFAAFRAEMKSRFAQVDVRFGALEGRMMALFLRVGWTGLRDEVRGRMDGLAGELRTLKWTSGSVMALQTLALGFLGFTLGHLKLA